jgi:hypothetical protein
MADGNKASNAPGFGNGNGTLKPQNIKAGPKKSIFLPPVPNKVY